MLIIFLSLDRSEPLLYLFKTLLTCCSKGKSTTRADKCRWLLSSQSILVSQRCQGLVHPWAFAILYFSSRKVGLDAICADAVQGPTNILVPYGSSVTLTASANGTQQIYSASSPKFFEGVLNQDSNHTFQSATYTARPSMLFGTALELSKLLSTLLFLPKNTER
jgi:hypothetical protein